ncbi:MAG: hypothetical protein ACLVJH_04485 [Faecalibacterium prausnitzii]
MTERPPACHPRHDPAQGVCRLLLLKASVCAASSRSSGCTAQLVGKLDNLAWLLNPVPWISSALPMPCPIARDPGARGALHQHRTRLGEEAAAELRPTAWRFRSMMTAQVPGR